MEEDKFLEYLKERDRVMDEKNDKQEVQSRRERLFLLALFLVMILFIIISSLFK